MRRPLVIYDFATAPFWNSLYLRKIWFSFLSVWNKATKKWQISHLFLEGLPGAPGHVMQVENTVEREQHVHAGDRQVVHNPVHQVVRLLRVKINFYFMKRKRNIDFLLKLQIFSRFWMQIVKYFLALHFQPIEIFKCFILVYYITFFYFNC